MPPVLALQRFLQVVTHTLIYERRRAHLASVARRQRITLCDAHRNHVTMPDKVEKHESAEELKGLSNLL